ncbi:MAG: hypothetical protein RIC87_20935 [Kiloniellales bacterium]
MEQERQGEQEERQRAGDLRAWLARQTASGGGVSTRPLGVAPLDQALAGGGLASVGLHCLGAAPGSSPAVPLGLALAFAKYLRAETRGAAAGSRPLIWVAREDFPYAPGLKAFGLAARDLLLVRAEREQGLLWALEECLRSGQAPVVLGRLQGLERVAGRRLQLAAERGKSACLLVETRPSGAPLPALTRWQVAAAPSGIPSVIDDDRWASHRPAPPPGRPRKYPDWVAGRGSGPVRGNALRASHPDNKLPGAPRWRLTLQQSRGGRPAEALVEWDDATCAFSLVTQPGYGELVPDAQACG